MPNPIKYSTGSETNSLKKGNFFIGTGDIGKGPSDVTGFYQGPNVPSGGYTIYLYNENSSSNLSYHVANNDEELISFTNGISNQSFTSSTECISWINTQTGRVIFNRDFEPFITDGLVFYVDPSKIMSYITGNTSVYDVTNNYSGITQNGVSFSNENEGIWSFDGTDDNILFQNLNLSTTTGATFMFWSTNDSTDGAQSPFGYHRSYWTIRSSQTSIYIGYGGIEHSSSFERSSSFSNTGINWRFLAVRVTGSSGSFFKDGVKLSNFSNMPSTIDSNPTMYIGRRAFPSPYSFNGNIGNILIYNRPLSDEEIVYNYEATGKRFVSLEVQYLVIAGGGGPGMGGGGAGGYLEGTTTSLSTNISYTITVGAGGPGFVSGASGNGTKGSDSVFTTITSTGGGYGGSGGASSQNGGPGGSGGGGGGYSGGQGGAGNTPSTNPSQGNNGGAGNNVVPQSSGWLGGGGGGSGGVGGDFIGTTSGNGGSGTTSSITGIAVCRAGGGVGAGNGGGRGTTSCGGGAANTNGTINTGGGGGGRNWGNPGGSGGSGVVIIKIPNVYNANFSNGVTFTKSTSVSGYKIYTVTATSTTSETVSFS